MSGTTIAAVATAAAPDRPAGAPAGGAAEDVGFVAALVAALAGPREQTSANGSEAALSGSAATEVVAADAQPDEAAPAGTALAGMASAGEHVLTTLGRWLGSATVPNEGATSPEIVADQATTGSASAVAATLEGPAENAEDGPAPQPAGTHAARADGTVADPKAEAAGLPSGTGTVTPAYNTQGAGAAAGVTDAADAVPTTAPIAPTTAMTSAAASSDVPTVTDASAATAPASATAAPAAPPADAGSLAGRIMSRVLDALDVLENAPPPRRMTVDIGDPSGTRLQVALRGSEVHVSVLGGGPEPQLTGWSKDLSAALEARGFSLGNSDAGHGQRRDQDGTAPDDQSPATPSPSGASPTAPVTPDTGLRL